MIGISAVCLSLEDKEKEVIPHLLLPYIFSIHARGPQKVTYPPLESLLLLVELQFKCAIHSFLLMSVENEFFNTLERV
jgi:hypothetical protein